MNTANGKDNKKDKYNNLSNKGKQLIEMYITARQFKNAILEDEIIILSKQQEFPDNTVINWGGIKITFRGDKNLIRTYPFVVNMAFSCEVYLKLLLIDNDFNFEKLKNRELHDLSKLYENNEKILKEKLCSEFKIKYGNNATLEFIENEIAKISNVFIDWRYIYEKRDLKSEVNYGFLIAFCSFLDRYAQNIIYSKYDYNVDENMR